ncbi:conserved Plasmodium protein, unknown function [Plasmodium knowlesi strain H]|uniref:Uncharacterized protein n=3 Tax=Plasmodium knowlesi TaxID=5850 RepID=A0A5K1VSR2_PLAKH|nr:conserved Plasmodium protein, unknown function [Plasmodium knowlesi strain H]OTN66738.1 Uncharacterized protein PKNOH_S08489100 [Plasmodium knowlesi]CAA9986836.1 conserved Plasmodium protein, unknown function [Plasmodium knowlesi strain H]SBO23684.1 conserved Plasmodium protein, unknown function [Plasmodium knowlesi strain H]SBO25277.1 conserved Plasmodium protein, unknown function [Plasmodium knowlesi strain H]VVS76310.1 conserved Plasmodium protein, unknown function [Plasmodium knowlesi s|eukprot:XP_002260680.1 hypothetical protein, conserved in Plasmodium species [Plasmodium knowlesi strain H]
MNENKKLEIIRNMLHTLLGESDKEREDDGDTREEKVSEGNNNPLQCDSRGDHRNVCNDTEKEHKEKYNLKKKYVEKSKEVISFYRNYMNKSEQKELEKYANLYDIVLNNSFEYTERDSIDTYMYCNVFPMLKKTFDAFVLYVSKLYEHKNDASYTKIIKNLDPIFLFSQYIIRLTDEDSSQSDKENSLFEEELSGCFSPEGGFQKKVTHELDKLIHDECFVTTDEMPTNGTDLDHTTGRKRKDEELTQVEKEINDFYNNYDLVEEENKIKKTQKRRDILKSIYSKKNVLSTDEIALYNSYYEERIKVKGKKVLTGRRDSSLILNLAPTNSFGNVAVPPNAFNITLDLEETRGGISGDASGANHADGNHNGGNHAGGNASGGGELQVKEKGHPNVDTPCDDHPDGVGENLDDLIKQLERRESSYFEKRIHFVLDKWVREEDGRRLIIKQKDKIKLIFDEFKKKNYTITDKDIIPLLFYIDKKLFLNYTLVHQYNFNNFHYIFFLHSSFYCSDTNSITFEELWTFLVSNLPLNSHLYKEDILIGLEKFYRKKKMIQNFQFTITFVRNFLLFLLMDIFLFLSRFVKQELSHHPLGPLGGSGNVVGISLAHNFYLHMDSLSPFFSSSEESSTEVFSSMEKFRSVCAPPSMHRDNATQGIHGGDSLSEKDESEKTLPPFDPKENNKLGSRHSESKSVTLHPEGCVKRNMFLHLLMLLWGINIKMDGLQEEILISDELSTDMEGEGEAEDAIDALDGDGAVGKSASAKTYEDARAPEGNDKPLHRRTHQQINPQRKKDEHEFISRSDGEIAKKGISNKLAKGMASKKRSLSTDGGNRQYSLKKTSVEDAIRHKKKINEDELEEEKKRKEKKRTHDMYTLRKKYKKKNYKKKLSILVHSIVKNIKPRKKNYYNKLLQMLNGGAKQVFWDLFLLPLEGYDQFTTDYDIGWALGGLDDTTVTSTDGYSTFRESASGEGSKNHLGDSLHGSPSSRSTDSFTPRCGMHTLKGGGGGDPSKIPFFPEDEIFPQVENFIQTYIKKRRKKKSSDGDHKKGDITIEELKSSASPQKRSNSSIRLLCSFRLYKKKFLNKFTTEHIYLLLLFVCYVNKSMDFFFLRPAGTKGK